MNKLVGEWCGEHPDDPQPIVYHGGNALICQQYMAKGGQPSWCVSYYYHGSGLVNQQKHLFLEPERPEGSRAFVDSGAFTFLATRSKQPELDPDGYMRGYAAWVKDHSGCDFYITFDYKISAPLVFKVTEKLRGMGIAAVPVYHGDGSLDWLKRYADAGHKLVCLSKRNFLHDRARLYHFFDQAFNLGERLRLRFHGLACGLGPDVWNYPWWSIDSTSLNATSARGSVIVATTKGLRIVNISRQARLFDRSLQEVIEQAGFQIADMGMQYPRLEFSAQQLSLWQAQRRPKPAIKRTLF